MNNMMYLTNQAKTVALMLLLVVACVANAMPTGATPIKKDSDPWQTMMTVMSRQGMDTTNVTVYDTISGDKNKRKTVLEDYAKTMNVKEPVTLNDVYLIGDCITATLKMKYAKKKGEEWDYRKVQYSIDVKELLTFLQTYPKSKYADEIRSKAGLVRQYDEWHRAKTIEKLSELYSILPGNVICPYVGYRPLTIELNSLKSDWREWMRIANSSSAEDFAVYEEYERNHPNTLYLFRNAAVDSTKVCRERYDYRMMMKNPTITILKDFLSRHPGSAKEPYVRSILAEKEAWAAAENGNTHEDYLTYLQRYPLSTNAAQAKERMRRIEEPDWNVAVIKNTEVSYTSFLDKWPEGYYAETAANRQLERALAKNRIRETDMQKEFNLFAPCSQLGYSKIRVGNWSMNYTMTISISGSGTSITKKLSPGQFDIWAVPNGKYSIYIVWSGPVIMSGFNAKGKLTVENGCYHLAMYTYDFLKIYISDEERQRQNTDPQVLQRWHVETGKILDKEKENLRNQESAVKKSVLRSFYRQLKYDDEEYQKIYRDLEEDEYLDLFLDNIQLDY